MDEQGQGVAFTTCGVYVWKCLRPLLFTVPEKKTSLPWYVCRVNGCTFGRADRAYRADQEDMQNCIDLAREPRFDKFDHFCGGLWEATFPRTVCRV